MAFVVVNIESEYLPDGAFHIYSPDVPGFHVVERQRRSQAEIFYETALPVLEQTMSGRVAAAKVGERVTFRFREMPIIEIGKFVPDELNRRFRGSGSKTDIPKKLLAEIT
jgi:hypothetical protein